MIEVAKEDYEEASKHGILAPPPADASWAGKLFHQAKELFVRARLLDILFTHSPYYLFSEILLEWREANQY